MRFTNECRDTYGLWVNGSQTDGGWGTDEGEQESRVKTSYAIEGCRKNTADGGMNGSLHIGTVGLGR